MKHSLKLKNLEGCTLNELEVEVAHQQMDNHDVVFTIAMAGGGISPLRIATQQLIPIQYRD